MEQRYTVSLAGKLAELAGGAWVIFVDRSRLSSFTSVFRAGKLAELAGAAWVIFVDRSRMSSFTSLFRAHFCGMLPKKHF